MPLTWLHDIPPEIRNKIYTEVFQDVTVHLQEPSNTPRQTHANSPKQHGLNRVKGAFPGAGLLFTNKQVSHKAQHIFWKEATFDLFTLRNPQPAESLVKSETHFALNVEKVKATTNNSILESLLRVKKLGKGAPLKEATLYETRWASKFDTDRYYAFDVLFLPRLHDVVARLDGSSVKFVVSCAVVIGGSGALVDTNVVLGKGRRAAYMRELSDRFPRQALPTESSSTPRPHKVPPRLNVERRQKLQEWLVRLLELPKDIDFKWE